MTSAPALTCPHCGSPLGPKSWVDEHEGVCLKCHADFEAVTFPAARAARAHVAPQAAVLAADSVCFFHAENRAEAICEGCGRLLCPVCAVPFAGQKLCPACIAAGRTSGAAVLIRDRVLWDGIALTVALVPLLIWPFTLITAPAALGIVIYAWKKPCSLVRGPSRARFVIAALLALGEIAAWVTIGAMVWLRR